MKGSLKLIYHFLNQNEIHKALTLIQKYDYSYNELNDVNFLKGLIFFKLKKYAKSIHFFKQNIQNKKLQVDSVNNICLILIKKNKKKIIPDLTRLLLTYNSNDIKIIFNIAKLYDFVDDLDNAINIINKINTANSEIISFKASLLRKQKKIKEAIKILKNHNFEKDSFFILQELAICFAYIEKYNDAINIINRLIKEHPLREELKYSKSLYLLHINDYKAASQLIDCRFIKYKNKEKFSMLNKLWLGNELNKLLIWSEDGLGDHILYLKLVEHITNVKRIYITMDKRLRNLYENYLRNKKINNITIIKNKIQLLNFDAHIPAGSLIKYINIKKIKKSEYLQPTAMNINTNFINVGIAWKTLNSDQLYRSVPFENLIQLLSSFKKLRIYNLQFGNIDKEIEYCENNNINLNVLKNIDYKNNIDKVSSLIKGLDFVVSAQNTVAHLASAIGKKVFLLLPIGHRWYWNFDEKSKIDNWYKNAKIFKQNKIYCWKNVLESLKKDLNYEISKNKTH